MRRPLPLLAALCVAASGRRASRSAARWWERAAPAALGALGHGGFGTVSGAPSHWAHGLFDAAPRQQFREEGDDGAGAGSWEDLPTAERDSVDRLLGDMRELFDGSRRRARFRRRGLRHDTATTSQQRDEEEADEEFFRSLLGDCGELLDVANVLGEALPRDVMVEVLALLQNGRQVWRPTPHTLCERVEHAVFEWGARYMIRRLKFFKR